MYLPIQEYLKTMRLIFFVSLLIYFSSLKAQCVSLINHNEWDSVQCGSSIQLSAQDPRVGCTGYWSGPTGTVFIPDANSAIITATISFVTNTKLAKFTWTVTDGNISSSDSITIHFYKMPVANSGGNLWVDNPVSGSEIKWDTICGNRYSLHPNLNGVGVLQWLAPYTSNIHFANTYTNTSPWPTDTVIVGLNNSDPGNPPYYEFYLQMDNSQINVAPFSHGCIDKDTLRITFARIPTGNIFIRPPYCYGDTALISPDFDPLGQPSHFTWDFHGGTVESCRPNSSTLYPNDSIYLIVWDTTGIVMEHTVSLVTNNPWGCYSQLITDTIFEPTPVYPMVSIDPTTCMNCNGKIMVYPIDSLSTSYLWVNPPDGQSSSSDSLVNLCSGYPYNVRFRYQSWSPNIFCTDTISLVLPDTGMITASFAIDSDTGHVIAGLTEVFFQNTTINGQLFNWHFGDGTISTASNVSHIYQTNGTYSMYLIAWSSFGCESISDSIIIQVESNSVEQNDRDKFNISIAPNPFSNNLKLSFKLQSYSEVKADIINSKGQTVIQSLIDNQCESGNHFFEFNTGSLNLKPGIYFLKMKINEAIYHSKIVME